MRLTDIVTVVEPGNWRHPYDRPLVAAQLLQAVKSVVAARYEHQFVPPRGELEDFVRREVEAALRRQIDMRGLAPAAYAAEMAREVSVFVAGGSVEIHTSPRWVESVDAQFHAGNCPRCGLFVAVPWNHEQRECDDFVVREVLET